MFRYFLGLALCLSWLAVGCDDSAKLGGVDRDQEGQGACIPDCEDRDCGDDGCGGECGTCEQEQLCVEHLCVESGICGNGVCEPDAGQTCQSCPEDCACDEGTVCFEDICCEQACHGATCGDDGCGGVCGTCDEGQQCVEDSCVDLGVCGNGICEPDAEQTCQSCPEDCACDEGAVCFDGVCCEPACRTAMCGDDGCGGECLPGCGEGYGCTEQGFCAPLNIGITSLIAMPPSTSPLGTISLRVAASSTSGGEFSVLWEVEEELGGTGWVIEAPDLMETTVSAPDNHGATALIRVTVSQPETSLTAVGNLVVSTVEGRGPVLNLVVADPPVVQRGGETILAAEATHPGGLDMVYSWELPAGWNMADGVDSTSASVRVLAPDVANAVGLVRVRVEDSAGLSVLGGVYLTTLPLTQPVISDITAIPSVVIPGGTITVTVDALDPDTNSDEGLLYLWEATDGFLVSQDLGEQVLVTDARQIQVFAPDTYDTYGMVMVTVDNGELATSTAVVVATRTNRPPVILSVPSTTTISEGWDGAWTYQVVAMDPDGDDISYELVTFDSSATISDTGLVSWYPGCSELGARPMTVVVTDAHGASAEQHLNMQVDISLLSHRQVVQALHSRLPSFGNTAENYMPKVEGSCREYKSNRCLETTWSECVARGKNWDFGGAFSRCDPACHQFHRVGSCCMPGGCIGGIRHPEECESVGGLFMGYGTDCKQHGLCAGACCTPRGCTMALHEMHCREMSGHFMGTGSICDEQMCIGACCLDDGCVEESPDVCIKELRGVFRGLGTNCNAPAICTLGACCYLKGCKVTSQLECEAEAGNDTGQYMGDGTSCQNEDGTTICIGACCHDKGCDDTTVDKCLFDYSGSWEGFSTRCAEVVCE